ncbi:MAG TPA: DUF6600 domain-containing protein [Candidatus Polarisedimenticolia bacterium]|jgi:hypothetical protein|nr:DUF6600 domain-containing protein [Candidatus Polarisedimenticolia bacterium]
MMIRRWGGIGAILIGCALAGACVTTGTSYHETVSMGTTAPIARPGGWDQPFYNDLAPHGRWVFVTGPGWVWSPDNVQVGWRPYQVGHWVYTDYGWTWASDEEWGWAVYHYGRWHLDNSFGWVWVPGTEWGPAWVAWHEGGGYVGWAPLPWQVTVRAGVGLDWGGVSVSISPSWWCFASTRYLVDPGLRTRIVPVERNTALIRVTQNVTNYTYIDSRVINQGVRVEKVGRAVGHTIPRYRVAQDDAPEVSRGGKVRGQDFVVYRADPVRGRNSRGRGPDGRDQDDRSGRGRVTEERDPRGQDEREVRGRDQNPGDDAPQERDARDEDWRNRGPKDRVAPPGRDDRDRARDDRPGRPTTEADTQESQPEDTQAPPDNTPPATNRGQERKDQGRDSHPSRGRRLMDDLMGKQPPARSPQRSSPAQSGGSSAGPSEPDSPSDPGNRPGTTTPPAKSDPVKTQPAQESARDKAKPGGDTGKGRKPKQDAPKSDKAGDAKPDDDKPKENRQDRKY